MWKLLTAPKLLAAGALAAVGVAIVPDTLPGPIPARVIRVVDGDTVEVEAQIWLGQTVQTAVRLRGVDTPELRGKCADERVKAQAARDLLAARVGPQVMLLDVGFDKYGGRVVARLHSLRGQDMAAELVKAGLARPYDGGGRTPWCPA